MQLSVHAWSCSDDLGRDQKRSSEARRLLFDSRGRVHGVADDRIFEAMLITQGTGNDISIVDTNADPDRRQALGGSLLAPAGNGGERLSLSQIL